MKKPKVIILSGYGLNCEEETKFAFELAGGVADIVHINDLIKKPVLAMNIWFESLYEAMKFLNISYDKIYNRIINDFTGYRYLYTINRSDHHRIN